MTEDTSSPSFVVNVTFGKEKRDYTFPGGQEPTVLDLMALIEAQTGVFQRQQKLLCKGRVLGPTEKLVNNAKIMLLSSAGPVVATAGQAAMAEEMRKRKAEAEARALSRLPGSTPSTSTPSSASFLSTLPQRVKSWAATGVVSCRDVDLEAEGGLPSREIASVASSSEKLKRMSIDLHGCRLKAIVPPTLWQDLGGLLRRLRLSGNDLSDASIGWEAICSSLVNLEQLVLDSNRRLTTLPDALSGLTSLQVLSARGCGLTSVPASLASLPSLRTVVLSKNSITTLPEEWGNGAAFEELYLMENRIEEIPGTWGAGLGKLRVLQLDSNRIKKVPANLLKNCASLSLLSVYNNPIVIEELRDSEGYKEYNARRIAQVDKQLDNRVKANLNEGADFAREEWGGW